MNCCDEFGDCCQGRDCPARTGTVLPHQALHACQVARIKSTRPIWMDGKANPVPPEAGNFQITYLGPDENDDSQPLTHDETMALVRSLLFWFACVVAAVVMLVLAVSVSTEHWADGLWAYLAQLS